MKKRIIALLGITVLSIGIVAGCGRRAQTEKGTENASTHDTTTVQDTTSNDTTVKDTSGNETTSVASSENIITEGEAKKIALKDAGVNETEVTKVRIKLEHEDGKQVYDVDFYVGDKEYDYTISAENGTIMEKDMEIENDVR